MFRKVFCTICLYREEWYTTQPTYYMYVKHNSCFQNPGAINSKRYGHDEHKHRQGHFVKENKYLLGNWVIFTNQHSLVLVILARAQ